VLHRDRDTNPGTIYTPQVTAGREVGVRLDFSIESGTFNSVGIVIVSAFGVQTNGQYDIGVAPSDLITVAEVGQLIPGSVRTAGKSVNQFYQFQFGLRSDADGVIRVDLVDFDFDNDDPNFGDSTLFP
jgi:hypothetical protein